MSVIGPADLLRTVHKDGNMIQAVVLTQEGVDKNASKSQRPPPPKSYTEANEKIDEEKPQSKEEKEGD
jgi:hypothetical protein